MSSKRCAYLTMENTDGWSIDADLGFAPMEALGWQVEAIPWRTASPDWNRFDAVYIGVPWDYPEDPERFLSVLGSIDHSSAILVNDLALVQWSLSKTYLRDLEARGAAIVPSRWHDEMCPGVLDEAFDAFHCDRIIVKPVVNTNATDTYLLGHEEVRSRQDELRTIYEGRPFVVQPFIESIQTEGEYSLFYFDRVFSHAIRKVPKEADFRVQEEYGAEIIPIEPEQALLKTCDAVMRLVEPKPVYARIDFVREPDGRFLVMELELIEPSMYLRMSTDAPQRFAGAFNRYVAEKTGETGK